MRQSNVMLLVSLIWLGDNAPLLVIRLPRIKCRQQPLIPRNALLAWTDTVRNVPTRATPVKHTKLEKR